MLLGAAVLACTMAVFTVAILTAIDAYCGYFFTTTRCLYYSVTCTPSRMRSAAITWQSAYGYSNAAVSQ
jgi:hypothetical protein